MNVMHLISGGDTGGAKTHVLNLVRTLSEVSVVSLVCLTDGPFYREAKEAGLPVILSEQRSRTDLSAIRRLHGLIRKQQPDLIHCHGARANFLGALLRRRIPVPLITTMHSDYRRDFEDNLYKHLVYSTLNAISLRRFDHYLAVTENFRGMLIDRGFPGGRVHTIYNGLEFAEAPGATPEDGQAFRRAHGIPLEATLVGMVGRMARVKRHDVLLRAAASDALAGDDAHFLLVGDGEERNRLQALASSLGLGGRVHFTGHLDDTTPAMSAMDINVLPSESESFPYALLEGAHHGLATIATPVGGVPELILDGRTGYQVAVDDPEDLASRLCLLVRNPKLRRGLGRSLKQHATSRFSLRAMQRDHLEIYTRVIAMGRRPQQVTVSGYFGFGNLGDEALLRGLIRGLKRENPAVDIWVLSADPKGTARSHRVSATPRFSPLGIISRLHRSRLFISGGGTLLQDETSLRSLVYYSSLIYAARVMRTPVMIYANGIGPLHSGIGRSLAVGALRTASRITLRDRASAGTLRALLGNNDAGPDWEVTADPAFALRPADRPDVEMVLDRAFSCRWDDHPIAVISMRPWRGDSELPARLAARAADLLSEQGFISLLMAMQESRDLPLAKLAAKMTRRETAVLCATGMQPELVMGIMERSDLVLGMRLHALILAAAAGSIPVGLSYDPKIDGFLSDIGAPCLGRMENMTPERLEEGLLEHILPRLSDLRPVVSRGARKMQDKEEENARHAASLLK